MHKLVLYIYLQSSNRVTFGLLWTAWGLHLWLGADASTWKRNSLNRTAQHHSDCKEKQGEEHIVYISYLSPSVEISTSTNPSAPTLNPAGPPRPPLSIFRAASAALCLAAFLLGPWPVQLISPTATRNVKLGWWACPSAFSRSYTGVLPIRVPYSCSRLIGVFPGFTASICSILGGF